MTSKFSLPHINLETRRESNSHKSTRGGGFSSEQYIDRKEHGMYLSKQLVSAFKNADKIIAEKNLPVKPEGVYLEVEIEPKSNFSKLERKKDNIRPCSLTILEDDRPVGALFVPNSARENMKRIFNDYTDGELTNIGNPPLKAYVEPICEINVADIRNFWIDELEALPEDMNVKIWWEVWCFSNMKDEFKNYAEHFDVILGNSEDWLEFPDRAIVPVYSNRKTIELMLISATGIAELKRVVSNPSWFNAGQSDEKISKTTEFYEQVVWPSSDSPAVCLLDTGVNRRHILIKNALSATDMDTIIPEWGVLDDNFGHGTRMAGLSLFGDLTSQFRNPNILELKHRLESVKILEPNNHGSHDPESYGPITQQAILKGELLNVERKRVFCMAVTNDNVLGEVPTSWSASIDQAIAGMMPAEKNAPKRLFFVSTGNAPSPINVNEILPAADYVIEEPANAWNAITVGGYTEKSEILELEYDSWNPLAQVGDLSPHTRTSVRCPNTCPIKPEIVMEGGNRAIDPTKKQAMTLDSLSALTTSDSMERLIETLPATSAATAQGSRLAARLIADNANYWPETIRALIIHSAEWTQTMRNELQTVGTNRSKVEKLRKFGYGVPSYERATASSKNHLALVAQSKIQPYKREGREVKNECHYYDLPWPIPTLEELGSMEVRLKVTLSYFVEPNPSSLSNSPSQYRSFGLQFDLKRSEESEEDFLKRVNKSERDDPDEKVSTIRDSGWMLGQNSIRAGSLHVNEWTGTAVELSSRNKLCIYPVTGWWKGRAKKISTQMTRYSLVVTLSVEDTDVDIYNPISNIINADSLIEV